MHETASPFARDFRGEVRGDEGMVPTRREPRDAVVRLVEYAPFPRVRRDQRWRLGFSHDLSSAGLCLRAERAVPVGSLLRVVVRSVDGRPTHDSIARVVWCRERFHAEAWLGLALIAGRVPKPGNGGLPLRRGATPRAS